MAKLRRLSILILLLLASLAPASAAADSRSDMTLGVGGGYTSVNESGYASVYFRYWFASHVRIAPSVAYAFRHEGLSSFGLNLDMHFPFSIARGVQAYPLAGVAFANWNHPAGDSYNSRFGLNAGAGIDLKFTRTLRLSIEGKYQFMERTHGAWVGMGLGYNF